MIMMRSQLGHFNRNSKRSISTGFKNCRPKEVKDPPNEACQQNQGEDLVIPSKNRHDRIGPPDRLSNIRPIKFYVPPNETPLQYQLRKHRQETNEWNDEFWRNHNKKFKKMKAEFLKVRLEEKYANTVESQKRLTAEEMSEFYKKFLDEHRDQHIVYNKEWYKRNLRIMYLTVCVRLQNLLKVFKT